MKDDYQEDRILGNVAGSFADFSVVIEWANKNKNLLMKMWGLKIVNIGENVNTDENAVWVKKSEDDENHIIIYREPFQSGWKKYIEVIE